jgi:membrane-bound ClpP family serine protease
MKRLEQFGSGMSLLCAVHCAATPILVSVLPLLGERLAHSHWVEASMIGVAASIGYVTLGASFRRHGRLCPLVLLTLGLLMVLAGHTLLPHNVGTAIVIVGGLTLAGAQLLNRRYPAACCSGH